jgi:integrase
MLRELTVKMIDALPKPAQRVEVLDRLTPGLRLVMQPSGAKSWAVRYNIEKKKIKQTLGPYPDVPLAKARELALEARRSVALGHDPQAAADATEAAKQITINEAADIYERVHVSTLRLATVQYVKRELAALKEALGERMVSSIKPADLTPLTREAGDRGPHAKNTTVKCLRAFFEWCINPEQSYAELNPMAGFKKVKVLDRDRFLGDGELRLLWDVATKVNGTYGALVKLLILTGARRNEIAKLEWSEIRDGYINLSGERTKTGEPHKIFITPAMQTVFETLTRKGKYVLGDGRRPLSASAWARKQVDVALINEPWTFHDLRRSFRSGLARLKVPFEVSEACLNHTINGVAGVYNRHDYVEEMKAAWIKWSEHAEAGFPDLTKK